MKIAFFFRNISPLIFGIAAVGLGTYYAFGHLKDLNTLSWLTGFAAGGAIMYVLFNKQIYKVQLLETVIKNFKNLEN